MMYKKIALFVTLLTVIGSSVQAQARFDLQRRSEFSIGLEGAVPTNGWNYDYTNIKFAEYGGGITLKYVYNINHLLACSFQTGYIFFPGKDMGPFKLNAGQLPLKAGLRLKTHNLYIEPQFGASAFHTKALYDGDVKPVKTYYSPFTYALGIGALVGKSWDIGFRYEGLDIQDNLGYIALRLGYRIPLDVD